MTKRTVQASGLKQGGGSARRAVSASDLSAGTNTISPDLRRDTHTLKCFKEPHRTLRTDLVVAALFLSGHAPDRDARSPGRYRGKVSRLRYSGVALSYFYSSKLRSSGP